MRGRGSMPVVTINPGQGDALRRWELHSAMAVRYQRLDLAAWAQREAQLAAHFRARFLAEPIIEACTVERSE